MNEFDEAEINSESLYKDGVKARRYGPGNPWSEEHRLELGKGFHAQDLDGVLTEFVAGSLGINCEERLMTEYCPDNYVHRLDFFREFATVAVFDHKMTMRYAVSECNRVSLAYYLHVTRKLSVGQPVPASFFIIEGAAPPWTMRKLDTTTGKEIGAWQLETGKWKSIWASIGLIKDRQDLRKWIESKRRPAAQEPSKPIANGALSSWAQENL